MSKASTDFGYRAGTLRGITSYLHENSRIDEVANITFSSNQDSSSIWNRCSHEQYMADIRKYDPIPEVKTTKESIRLEAIRKKLLAYETLITELEFKLVEARSITESKKYKERIRTVKAELALYKKTIK